MSKMNFPIHFAPPHAMDPARQIRLLQMLPGGKNSDRRLKLTTWDIDDAQSIEQSFILGEMQRLSELYS